MSTTAAPTWHHRNHRSNVARPVSVAPVMIGEAELAEDVEYDTEELPVLDEVETITPATSPLVIEVDYPDEPDVSETQVLIPNDIVASHVTHAGPERRPVARSHQPITQRGPRRPRRSSHRSSQPDRSTAYVVDVADEKVMTKTRDLNTPGVIMLGTVLIGLASSFTFCAVAAVFSIMN